MRLKHEQCCGWFLSFGQPYTGPFIQFMRRGRWWPLLWMGRASSRADSYTVIVLCWRIIFYRWTKRQRGVK